VPDLTFGARLALIRHKMGWNIKEAATACGVPPQSWRGWELNAREPHRLTTISMAIASRTGVDYLWLVHGPNRGGAITRSASILGPHVLTAIGASERPIHRLESLPTRPVRQTRPIVGAARRPLAPAVL
jgi:transcriptional regulator with XRE-family HTH domain